MVCTGLIFSGWLQFFEFSTRVKIAEAAEVTIDGAVSITEISHVHFGPQAVFTSDQNGYKFYRDASGECVYSKTTDGGATWGGAVIVDDRGADTDCLSIAVWYDKWTPGDTGTNIHIATMDTASDTIWYNALDTSSDTRLTGSTAIDAGTNAGYTAGSATLSAGANYPTITKGTDGTIYIAIADGGQSIVVECSTTCGTTTNWTETGTNPLDNANDQNILMPLASGSILLIDHDISGDVNRSKVWNNTSWDASWTSIGGTVTDNLLYDQVISATIDPTTNDIYLAYLADVVTLGTDDDIGTAIYSGGSWTTKTNAVTNSACAATASCGISSVSIAFNTNNKDVYVAYSAIGSGGGVTNQNVYWKKSTDGMATWGSESSAVSASNEDIYNVDLNMVSADRIFVFYGKIGTDVLNGDTIANLVPPTYEQASFRLFANANSTDVGSALAALNTAATLSSAGDAFRLRALLHVGGDGTRTSLNTFKLQFAQQSGTCDTSFSGETYADVTGATVIAYNDNATPTDGATLTANGSDPTHSTDTIVNQTYEEANNFTNSVAAIPTAQDGKWDFSLKDNGATAGTAYCLRIIKSDATNIDTYTVIPQITTASGSQTLTFSLSANSVALGTLSSSAVTSGSHTVTLATNASNGLVLTYSGTTLTSGANTITAISSATTSSVGTEQFGINAKDNATPNVGAECSGSVPIAAAATGYATADNFKFVTGETLISSNVAINSTTCTISYISNIAAPTESGSYTTTLTYTVTASF